MKAVANRQGGLRDDPRPRDRAMWQRLRVLVEEEACHRDWGCVLYTLHRTGRIDNDQREAGDRYARLAWDYKKTLVEPMMELQGFAVQGGGIVEPATGRQNLAIDRITGNVVYLSHALAATASTGELSEFEEKRIVRLTKRYKQAKEIAGSAWRIVEDMLLDEVWPVGERGHKVVSEALTRLSHFFSTGTKRKR